MAQVVDVLRGARAAFGEFAVQHLKVSEGYYEDGVLTVEAVDACARYLIENKVLSREELDLALERMQIRGVAVC